MTPTELIAWRKAHDFTQGQAAEALGVSRRALGQYEADGATVPKLVALACRGFDQQPLTDEEVVALANALAHRIYALEGRVAPEDFKFYATAPTPGTSDCREKAAWDAAAIAFDFLRSTDINDALSGVDA